MFGTETGQIDVDMPRRPSRACYDLPQHRHDLLVRQFLVWRLEQHGRDGSASRRIEQDRNAALLHQPGCALKRTL